MAPAGTSEGRIYWAETKGLEPAQARRLGHHLPNRVVETYSHVAAEVNDRVLDGLERSWHAVRAVTHADRSSIGTQASTASSGRSAA